MTVGVIKSNGTPYWPRLALIECMALPIFGLILIEQLARNVSEDSRWNAKPLCLGLSVVFLFDLYLYSQAVLFGQIDVDAMNIHPNDVLSLKAKKRSRGCAFFVDTSDASHTSHT